MSQGPIIWNRRHFMTALGLGAGSLFLPSLSRVRAQSGVGPRVVFFITPHGTVPGRWRMRQSNLGNTEYEYALSGLGESQFSDILRPLHRHRGKLLVVDGLARTTVYAEIKRVQRDGIGGDANEHHLGQAHLLTSNYALQRSGNTALGGARTIDQGIGDAVGQAGRWASRVYGFNHQHPYSFVASGEPSPREQNPGAAFQDIMGMAPQPSSGGPPTRADLIRAARGSALDMAAGEFERAIPKLSGEDRLKLERHQQLVRDLEVSLSTPGGEGCNPTFTEQGHVLDRFSRLTAMALACDLTRVVTVVTPNLSPTEFGANPALDVHQDIAHASDEAEGTTAGIEGMVNYNKFYAERFAYLLDQLDSISEGGGTVLDNTVVVWLTELGTGTHELHGVPTVLAGGASGYFRTGRYVHFPETLTTPFSYGQPFSIGPGQSRLFVNLMHAMGMTTRDYFGLAEVPDANGNTISLRGPLPRLR